MFEKLKDFKLNVKIGLVIAVIACLFLFVVLMNPNSTYLEKAILSIFFSLIIVFGVLLESGWFPSLMEGFESENHF